MFPNSQSATFRKFDKLWLVLAAFLGLSVIPAVGFVLLGPGTRSLLLSRSVVLIENLLALGYLMHTAYRARGSARAFWSLMASVLGIWAIANVAWTHASYTANEFPINSIWWSFYRLAGVPIAMTFFLKDRTRQPRLDPELILDWTQVTILVSATYFVLHYLPIQQMSLQAALVRNEIGTNMENLLLLGGAVVIFLYRRSSGLRPLFARLVLLLLGYSIVAAAGNYLDAHLAAPNSAWKDLLWSISYVLLPAIASTWEPSNKEQEAAAITGRERSFGMLLASNLALMTLLILILALAEYMQGGWRVLGICMIAISLLIYAARLAMTQYSQQVEVRQRKNAEEALQEAYRETELLLNSVPSILINLDPGGRIRRWNRAATAILGWDESNLVGKTMGNSGIKWLLPDIDAKLAAALADPRISALDDLTFDRDGNTHFLGLRAIPLEEADGGSLIVGADVTERMVLEAQLRQAHKLEAIGQLASGIAHEINTPTQFVTNNTTFLKESWSAVDLLLQLAEMLQKELAETGSISETTRGNLARTLQQSDLEYLRAEVPTAIEQSLEGLQRVANIVRAMKEFSHPGSKGKTPIDINHAIETTIAVAKNEWKYVAKVVTNFADNLPLVPCIPGEFNQVILNLLVNAAQAIASVPGDHTQDKGTITISTRCSGNAVQISIQDTGVGIPEKIRNRVFEPFFTTKPPGKGTGQGLSLAHSSIVKRGMGKIWFESEVGVGTTFFIQIPLEETCSTASAGS